MSIQYKPYKVSVKGVVNDFEVLKFVGNEALNKPYEYVIDVISSSGEFDLESLLFGGVVLQMQSSVNPTDIFYVNGICRAVNTKGFFLDKYIYEITLVPKLWTLSLQQSSKVYMDVSISDIIERCMNINNFTKGLDYDIRLSEEYKELEFVCQYNESDLDFLTRWLETYGIYYYIVNDEKGEKVIFVDNNSFHSSVKNPKLIYSKTEHQLEKNKDTNISEFDLIHTMTHTAFKHDHYDGTRQHIASNKAAANAYDQDMTYRVYGGNPQVKDSFSKFDEMELQRLESYKYHVSGKGTALCFYSGGHFGVESKFKAINGEYLIKSIQHRGDQTALLTDKELTKEDKLYDNVFEAIPYTTQYRPKNLTPRPRFYGLLNATIDGIIPDKPLVDKMGRYKVLLPFDTLEKEEGKASVPVRVVQPSASNESSGMHFKLLKGDEVILGFREGDIDRPMILGAVNNSAKVSDVDGIKRENTSIELDNDVLIVQTPQKIEIIG